MTQRPLVEAVWLGEPEQAVATQVLDAFRRAVGLEVGRAGEDAQAIATQRAGMQGRVAQRADTDRDIGALLEQIDDLVTAVQLQLDVRVLLTKAAHQWHHGMQHERRCGVHPQAAGRFLPTHLHLLFGILDRIEDLARLGEKGPPLLGQFQAAGGAA
ncbi:hypothetical protein FQZ97_1069920 [compost metagenome]